MLSDLEPIKIPLELGGKKLYLRFSLNSHLYLEHYYGDIEKLLLKDIGGMNTQDAIHFLRAGLMECYFNENEEAITKRDWDCIKPSLAAVGNLVDFTGLKEIANTITKAIIASLPTPKEGSSEQKENFPQGAD